MVSCCFTNSRIQVADGCARQVEVPNGSRKACGPGTPRWRPTASSKRRARRNACARPGMSRASAMNCPPFLEDVKTMGKNMEKWWKMERNVPEKNQAVKDKNDPVGSRQFVHPSMNTTQSPEPPIVWRSLHLPHFSQPSISSALSSHFPRTGLRENLQDTPIPTGDRNTGFPVSSYKHPQINPLTPGKKYQDLNQQKCHPWHLYPVPGSWDSTAAFAIKDLHLSHAEGCGDGKLCCLDMQKSQLFLVQKSD